MADDKKDEKKVDEKKAPIPVKKPWFGDPRQMPKNEGYEKA